MRCCSSSALTSPALVTSSSIRRSSNISPARFAASETPSVNSTMRSPGVSAISRSSYRVSRKRRRSEEHTSELQSLAYLVCRLLLEKKKKKKKQKYKKHEKKISISNKI